MSLEVGSISRFFATTELWGVCLLRWSNDLSERRCHA